MLERGASSVLRHARPEHKHLDLQYPINGATNIDGHLRLAHHPASKEAMALWIEAGIVISNGYTSSTGWDSPRTSLPSAL